MTDPLPKFSVCAHCDDDIMLVEDDGHSTPYIHAADGRSRCMIYATPVLCGCGRAECFACARELHGGTDAPAD